MDETPVYFDMVGNLTIENCGAKTVQIRTTGNEKNQFTCVLTVLADGTKLSPIVIFKGKQMPKNLPSGIIVLMHPKGWMDESGMKTWFDKVWRKKPGGNRINKQRSLLVMDSFEGHKTNAIKKLHSMKILIWQSFLVVSLLLFSHLMFVLISHLKIDFVKSGIFG